MSKRTMVNSASIKAGSTCRKAALALAPGVSSAADNVHEEDEDNDGELLNPAERRAKRLAAAADRPPIYNAEAMHEKLEDISWPSEVLALLSETHPQDPHTL